MRRNIDPDCASQRPSLSCRLLGLFFWELEAQNKTSQCLLRPLPLTVYYHIFHSSPYGLRDCSVVVELLLTDALSAQPAQKQLVTLSSPRACPRPRRLAIRVKVVRHGAFFRHLKANIIEVVWNGWILSWFLDVLGIGTASTFLEVLFWGGGSRVPQACKSCIAYFQDLFRGYRLVPGPGGFVARRCLEIGKKFPSGDANSWQDSLRIVLEPSEGHGEPVSSEPNLWSGTYYHTISYHITYIIISYHIISYCFHVWILWGVLNRWEIW